MAGIAHTLTLEVETSGAAAKIKEIQKSFLGLGKSADNANKKLGVTSKDLPQV